MMDAPPNGWTRVRVDWLMDEVRDTIGPEKMAGREVFHYSIPALSEHGDGVIEAGDSIASAKPLLRGGELLVSKLNPRKSHVLISRARVDPTVCSGEFIVLRPRACDVRFMFYVFSSEAIRQGLDGKVQSVTKSHQRVGPDDITRLWVTVPSLETQRRIADFLDRETARIDGLMKRKQALLGLLDERLGKVVAGEGKLAFVNLSREGLPIPPKNYPVLQLGRVARIQSGITLDSGRAATDEEETVPYLRVANVQTGFLDLTEIKQVTVPKRMADAARLQPGDVLMTEGGDPDKLGRGTVWRGEIPNCIHQNHVFAIRPDPTRLLHAYLALVTRTPYGRVYFEVTASKTTGIASTSNRKIAAWPIPLPPLNEQVQIVQQAGDAEERTTTVAKKLMRQLLLLGEHRQALVTAAVTGQLDVSVGLK